MAESLSVTAQGKKERYSELFPQLHALLQDETDMIACMANISAALKETMSFFWVGFYLVRNQQLVLGPFQGPIACTRITRGKGVCGTAWREEKTLVVANVDQFPGHIACNQASKSEIVTPVFNSAGKVIAVLDIYSDTYDSFDDTDAAALEKICGLLLQKQ